MRRQRAACFLILTTVLIAPPWQPAVAQAEAPESPPVMSPAIMWPESWSSGGLDKKPDAPGAAGDWRSGAGVAEDLGNPSAVAPAPQQPVMVPVAPPVMEPALRVDEVEPKKDKGESGSHGSASNTNVMTPSPEEFLGRPGDKGDKKKEECGNGFNHILGASECEDAPTTDITVPAISLF